MQDQPANPGARDGPGESFARPAENCRHRRHNKPHHCSNRRKRGAVVTTKDRKWWRRRFPSLFRGPRFPEFGKGFQPSAGADPGVDAAQGGPQEGEPPGHPLDTKETRGCPGVRVVAESAGPGDNGRPITIRRSRFEAQSKNQPPTGQPLEAQRPAKAGRTDYPPGADCTAIFVHQNRPKWSQL